ncbi:immunity protein Imm33 domain-containing protein [Chryseobacterium sp. CT-SW4]|uniref:immunity protein Imm33 domain-containing protein n=1 Tax=Chryseobacterium sp. SW-1 TaxID=3157343 RepID=UPI003B02811F
MDYKKIEIKELDKFFYTEGLTAYIEKEIRLRKGIYQEIDYVNVIKYIIDCIVETRAKFLENQNIVYYSWLLHFKNDGSNYFNLYEANKNGEKLNEGCDLAIAVIKSQSELCSEYSLLPIFPNFNQMIVISKGVYEGKAIEGIRYDSPEHMSGWWLITDDYDDNIESLMTVHYYHVAFQRPDVLKYLALPFGYRFLMKDENIEIFKDEEE